jgi:2-polyprenyl-3-methyl-5-hydroxy-6-metoxy-1,4-benzoquinol methylase
MIRPATAPVIEYGLAEDAWHGYQDKVRALVLEYGAKTVCDIGGGANPVLPLDFVQQHGLDYVILDISAAELAKAPAGYRTRVQDVTAPLTGEAGTYDFVFSKMLAEHVTNPQAFHRNIHSLLRPGGIAFHFFPTLYAPVFFVNWVLPESLTRPLLSIVQRGRENSGRLGKFPAYYHWCRGPMRSQLARLESVGFEVVNYVGFFGNAAYFEKIKPAQAVNRSLARWLLKRPAPWLTSFAYVVLRRPPTSTHERR